MLKKCSFFLAIFATCWLGMVSAQESAAPSTLHWLSSYDEGLQQAQQAGKPVLVLFTGTDWCTWCKKLEEEILTKPAFAQAIGNNFVFVKLDFPLYKTSNPAETEKNKSLQKQFDVRGFPTIVLISPNGQKLGSTGYQATTPKGYADALIQMAK